jgi:hypothetical protein
VDEYQEPILASLLHGVRSWDEKDAYQGPAFTNKCCMSLRSWDEEDEYQEPALGKLATVCGAGMIRISYQGPTLTRLLHDSTEPGSSGWDEELGRVLFTNLSKLVA